MKRSSRVRLLLTLSLLCCGPAFAATIYKSIDENGVVSFSDTKPQQEVLVETMVIDVQAPSSSEATQQRLQEMRETTDRMVADRMARERHRAEIRQLDAQTAAQNAAQQRPQDLTEYYDNPLIFTGYRPYPSRWPGRHPKHHRRPDHPIVRPPLRPPNQQRPPGIRPLPGNDYPASLIRKGYDPKVRAALR